MNRFRRLSLTLAVASLGCVAPLALAEGDPTAATPDLREALLRLRQPEPTAARAQQPREPAHTVRLRGRLIHSEQALAIIESAPDRLHIVRVGEAITLPNEQLQVEAISLDGVILKLRSNQSELRLR